MMTFLGLVFLVLDVLGVMWIIERRDVLRGRHS